MGSGTYSSSCSAMRSVENSYSTKSVQEIFTSKNINNAMNPTGLDLRESRDSDEHPNSLAIILALDVTGSMGSTPHHLVKEGLPVIMDSIIKGGIADPQVLFLGIGDHEYDESPLQVGQFESSDELLDKWLTTIYLEGGGGPNDGESYMLAWYLAAKHTDIDCFNKRKEKGFLFTIGDEKNLKELSAIEQRHIIGDGQHSDVTSAELLKAAQEKYHVFHLHLKQGFSGGRDEVMNDWKQIIGDNLIIVDKKEDIPTTISDIISKVFKGETKDVGSVEAKNDEDMML